MSRRWANRNKSEILGVAQRGLFRYMSRRWANRNKKRCSDSARNAPEGFVTCLADGRIETRHRLRRSRWSRFRYMSRRWANRNLLQRPRRLTVSVLFRYMSRRWANRNSHQPFAAASLSRLFRYMSRRWANRNGQYSYYSYQFERGFVTCLADGRIETRARICGSRA